MTEVGTCRCPSESPHDARRVVLTGGPGAGKTAVLEVVRRHFCEHVAVLPEAASIVFGGGFPREPSRPAREAAQLAIYHVQDQLERLVVSRGTAAIALCDRGVVDGLAYWPGEPASFWTAVGSTPAVAFARYAAVIHLRTPAAGRGYDHTNPLRVETAAEAAAIDARIAAAWAGHPRLFVVESTESFLDKLATTLARLRDELPDCCRRHLEELGPQFAL